MNRRDVARTLDVSGGTGDSYDYARLWAAPEIGGVAGDTSGTFQALHLNMVAGFATAATLNSTTGWVDTSADPTTLGGTSKAIFQNDSTTNPANDGFYAFDFSFATGSWAANNGATWGSTGGEGGPYSPSSLFAAPANVPEPASLALVVIALARLLAGSRRQPIADPHAI